MASDSSSRSDYGTVTGQSTGFTSKEFEDQGDSLKNSIEDAIQRIRKNTENLRSICLRIRTRSINKTDLHGNINTLTRSTREIVEECVSQLRTLRLQSSGLVDMSDMQQRVSGAVNDFQRLSQEVILILRHSGKGKGSRRRKHNYRSFNDSGSASEAGLSDSMGYEPRRHSLDSSGRVSSPEQQVFIVTSPSRQVNFEDMESDLQALETIVIDMKMMSTEQPKTAHNVSNGSIKTSSSSQGQIQFSHQTQNSIDYYQSTSQEQGPTDSNKTKCCRCCCIS